MAGDRHPCANRLLRLPGVHASAEPGEVERIPVLVLQLEHQLLRAPLQQFDVVALDGHGEARDVGTTNGATLTLRGEECRAGVAAVLPIVPTY